MATPERVELVCPLCGSRFRSRTMGSSYFISGIDTDLREIGSIEEVRRFSISACEVCHYSDYSWDFLAPDDVEAEHRKRLEAVLQFGSGQPGSAVRRSLGDFERFTKAAQCFEARELDRSSLAELAVLAYYVARDLGRADLEPDLRQQAIQSLVAALDEEDLPTPMQQRYAYLAGELSARADKPHEAIALFNTAIKACDGEEDDEPGGALDIRSMARRRRTSVEYREASAEELAALCEDADPELASEGRRLLASRRDAESVRTTLKVWADAPAEDRTLMLRELVTAPDPEHSSLLREALESSVPENIRLAAQGLGGLGGGQPIADALLKALKRGVLSTEAVLIEALRRIKVPNVPSAVVGILQAWEERNQENLDDNWFFSSDTTPLRHFLYTSGESYGTNLLIQDMENLTENDLWDKVPSGGPVSAALTLGDAIASPLRALVSAENPAARRWSAYCLAELGQTDAREEIAPLISDSSQVVRLQAAAALARLGDPSHEDVVLRELKGLDERDLPFALHFLVPFKSDRVKEFLMELLEGDTVMSSEILPLIGRQEPDDRTQEVLTTALLATNDETRAGGVTGLAYQGGAEAAKRLRLLYDQEDSEEVQRRVIFGLGSLARAGHNSAETIAFLRDRIDRANPRLKFSMALTLLQLGDPAGINLVRERAALFDESADRYDLVAPASKPWANTKRSTAPRIRSPAPRDPDRPRIEALGASDRLAGVGVDFIAGLMLVAAAVFYWGGATTP